MWSLGSRATQWIRYPCDISGRGSSTHVTSAPVPVLQVIVLLVASGDELEDVVAQAFGKLAESGLFATAHGHELPCLSGVNCFGG